MSQLTLNLGNGKRGTVELDTFTRMLTSQIYDTEEMRMSRPISCANGFEYMAIAISNSSITDNVWSCIRRTWLNNKCVRIQFKENIAWSDKDIISW